MPDKLISELIELPEKVRKGDFVLKLSEGVSKPEKTLDQYVVTPQLVACFEDALSFIHGAVKEMSSKACYLHGSFGSGKSHFMAVLHLLLQHIPAVRNISELAKVCAHNEWVEQKKFLLVPYHMIGARNMETAILGGYVDHVMQLHPGAPLPGVYLADAIFTDARKHRQLLGDEKFFAQLNQGKSSGAGGGWGKLAKGWDAKRFEAALEAAPNSEERSRLVGDLVQHLFTSVKGVSQGKDEAYVDLDLGLSIISAHTKSLGYDGLILFLDELILWLASRSGDLAFLQMEGQKLSKLVESRKSDRPVPIISFVARQRDLRELIGDKVPGADQLNFSDVLSYWEGRFHTITLEDRNLPVIAQKRVLRAKDGACRAELDDAFEKTAQVRQEIMEILLTRESDRAMFKMVYPFSPALIQALVAVSSALQRERTALKLMLQMLVNRRDTLRLGDVIPLGDLWDVVAHGDEAFTDVMRVNFTNAKNLYQNKLVPMLEQQHGVDLEVDREKAKTNTEIAERLQRFDNDDRLLKSLLLSALVHGVESLKSMTAMRLAALNHGTIRSRIPGREHQVVTDKLRTWAGIVGEIRVSEEPTNPTVTLQLSGVDTETIIESAKSYDNISIRQFKIRQMLFQSLGIPEQDEMFISHTHLWRGTKRFCEVHFTNVHRLPDESLRSDEDWKLIIGFPFDTEGHTPDDNLDKLTKFRDKNERQRTLVWLPSFFSTRTQGELAKLVIIDRLLLGNNLEQHSKHLSAQDRETARLLLKNQQSALSQRLMQAVEAAYDIRSEPMPGTLDPAWDLSDLHFQSLFPTLVLQRPVGANLGEALEHLLDQAMSHQFPKHPKFGQEIKFGKDMRQVLEVCQEAVRSQDGRVFVEDKPLRLKLKNICNPLELGQMSETHFVLDGKWKTHFNRMLTQSGQTNPQVGEMRRWTDLPDAKGLPKEIQNLLILVYADQTNRSFRHVHHGSNYTASLDDLPNELELQEQTLPDLKDWNEAVTRVADIFGHAISKLLNASNLAAMAEKIGESITEFKTDCEALPDKVQLVLKNLGVSEADFSKCDRVRTAKAVKSLLANCDGEEPTALVGAIAHAKVETNSTSMGRSLKSAKAILECLGRTRWDLFSAVTQLQDDRKTAAELLIQDVCTWLKTDEHALAGGLASKLSDAEGRAIKLLTPPKVPEPIPPITPPPIVPGAKKWAQVSTGKKDRLASKDWQATAEELRKKLEENPAYRLTVQWLLEEEQK
jgi:hypothetical protein